MAEPSQLYDPMAMVKPLLDAQPGSTAVCVCKRCGGRLVHEAELDERGFFIHRGPCPGK